MRRRYEGGTLLEDDLAPTWLEQFQLWLSDAVEAGIREPNAMSLATAGADGRPGVRTVLLKGVDDGGFEFFTNLDSRKGLELRANPRAALLFPWIALGRQVVVDGDVELVGDADADAYFASRPHGSKLGALASAQSAVIQGREGLDGAAAELLSRYPEGSDGARPANWGGFRVVPTVVEFWQGRPNRLHDRLRYRREGASWLIERLSP